MTFPRSPGVTPHHLCPWALVLPSKDPILLMFLNLSLPLPLGFLSLAAADAFRQDEGMNTLAVKGLSLAEWRLRCQRGARNDFWGHNLPGNSWKCWGLRISQAVGCSKILLCLALEDSPEGRGGLAGHGQTDRKSLLEDFPL